MSRIHRAVIGVAFLVTMIISTGCVTRGSYEALEQQHEALRSTNATLEQSLRDAEAERARLDANLKQTRMQLAETQSKVDAMTGTYDELVAELRSEVASGQIEIQKVFDGIRLNVSDELLFPSGSSALNDAGRALLTRVAAQIKAEPAIVSVEGHTDNVRVSKTLQRRYPTNWELAGARAASVVRLLSEQGVDPARLRAVSRGPFAPIASNDTKEGRARNRRTEIVLRPIPTSR